MHGPESALLAHINARSRHPPYWHTNCTVLSSALAGRCQGSHVGTPRVVQAFHSQMSMQARSGGSCCCWLWPLATLPLSAPPYQLTHAAEVSRLMVAAAAMCPRLCGEHLCCCHIQFAISMKRWWFHLGGTTTSFPCELPRRSPHPCRRAAGRQFTGRKTHAAPLSTPLDMDACHGEQCPGRGSGPNRLYAYFCTFS